MTKPLKITKKMLKTLYIEQKKSGLEIANIFNCTRQTIYNNLKKNNIKLRSFSENNKGSNNPAWKGGVRGGYWRNMAMKIIKQSRKTKCERCDDIFKLEVHHKDKNWKNNNLNNLELLCRKCHRKHHLDENLGKYKWKKGHVSNIKVKIEKECLFCKNIFLISPCRKNTAKYCSKKCQGKHKTLIVSLLEGGTNKDFKLL